MDGKLYGIREISNYVGAPKHTVNYYIDKWSVQPNIWVAGRRVFNEATVQKFKEMLEITMKAKSFKAKN